MKAKLTNNKKIFMFLSFIMLILISGLRGENVGGDLNHYLANFPIIGRKTWNDLFEMRIKYGYIYSIINKIAFEFNSKNISYLMVTSIFNLVPVGMFIYKTSSHPLFSIFLYITFGLYTGTFNSVRASMALAVLLFSVRYIIQRKFWKFLLLFLIALEIHQTVVPFILLYPLYTIKISYKLIISFIGGCFLLSQLSSAVMFFPMLAFAYDSGSYEDLGTTYSGGYNLLLFITFLTCMLYFLNKNEINSFYKCDSNDYEADNICFANEMRHFCLWSMILACCILCFATCYTELTRLSVFFYFFVIIILPETLYNIINKNFRTIAIISCICFYLWYFDHTYMTPQKKYDDSNPQGTIPYKTYFD